MKPRLLSTVEIAADQTNGPISNANQDLESSAAEDATLHIVPASIDKIRRFCFLGTFEAPVYIPTTFDLTVEVHFAALRELCDDVSETDLVDCLRSVLSVAEGTFLPRHDEALLVLAVYLSTCTDEKKRTFVRGCFTEFVRSAKELFLFIKFVKHIQKLLERKTPFSRTVRKAVLDWYQNQPLDKLLHTWSMNDFDWTQHRDLLHRCHYTSIKCDAEMMAALRVLSTPCKELVKWPDYLKPIVHFKEIIVGISNLRLTQTADLGLPIIEKLSLSYEHLPRHILTDSNVVDLLLPKMSYEQLLHSWPTFLKIYKSNRNAQSNYTQRFFDASQLAAANVEPIRLLLQETRGLSHKKIISKGVIPPKTPRFIHRLYKQSFGCNKALGLRMHITLNLEMCYTGKSLTGRWRSVKYLDAVVALAFGYFKCDPSVSVQIWHDKTGSLRRLPWTPDMSVDEAKILCEKQKVAKIKQTLTDVVDNALQDKFQTYDVFLVMVPRGARGNPGNKSDHLTKRLDEYRQKRNMNAKFIILSLRQNHASMTYSKVRNENILELCSIAEHTPRLINAFTHGKFF